MMRSARIFLAVVIVHAIIFPLARASEDFIYVCKTDFGRVNISNGALSIEGGEENMIPGAPKVGYKIIRIILPPGTRADSMLTEAGQPIILARGVRLDFARGDIRTDMQPSAQITLPSKEIYQSDKLYPAKRAELLYSGHWGGNHIADVAVYPLAYRAKSGQVELFEEIGLRFKLSDYSDRLNSRFEGDPLARSILDNSVANREDLLTFGSSGGRISDPSIIASMPLPEHLVITSRDLVEGFEPFVEWKNQKGLRSGIVFIDEVLASTQGIDPPEKLRNYLISVYSGGVRWVLLGGDEDVIPIRYLYANNAIDSTVPPLCMQQIGDIYYSDLTGNWDADSDGVWGEPVHDQPDIYPEIFVGRVPVRNSAEAGIWSAKAIMYEKNPGAGDPEYLRRALVICADEMRDLGQHQQVERWLEDNFTVDAQRLIEEPSGSSLSPTQPTGQQVIDVMQEGWGFITNLNHGDFSYYASLSSGFNVDGRSDVWGDTTLFEYDSGYSRLEDIGKPGIHYSVSCDVGAFDFDKGIFYPGPYYTTYCLGESYLAQPGGGAAFLGYSRLGWLTSSLTLQHRFIRRVLEDSTCQLGVAEALSKVDYPAYPEIIYGHDLFGDPETPFWISVDGTLAIDGPEQIEEKQNQTMLFRVHAGENPIGNAKVCLYKKDQIFLVARTNDLGEVSFEVQPESTGIMTVTATLPRYIPAQHNITIQSFAGIDDEGLLPDKPVLQQNYPNPFNSSTTITYYLPSDGNVRLDIFDICGRLVRTLANHNAFSGMNRVAWDGKNEVGQDIASGLYLCRFESGDYAATRRMTVIR